MKRIPIYGRKGGRNGFVVAHALVDDCDYSLVSGYRWNLSSWGYAVAITSTKPRKCISMHKLILGIVETLLTSDHKNRNRLDNRRKNLRVVTKAQNQQNLPSQRGASSEFRGVSYDKWGNRWRAYVRVNGKTQRFGSFRTEQEAARVARNARRKFMPYSID